MRKRLTREESGKRNDKALLTVRTKSFEAAKAGKPSSANPYPAIHSNAVMAIGGVWWRHWKLGWDDFHAGKTEPGS